MKKEYVSNFRQIYVMFKVLEFNIWCSFDYYDHIFFLFFRNTNTMRHFKLK